MKIKEGDKLPDGKVLIIDMNKEYEHKEISTSEILNKDKIILFGLPGAFTPGCSKKHLPSFLESTEKLKEKNKTIVGYGAPAKATTALNFFGISEEIDFIVEANKLKLNKFIPGVKILIKNKSQIKNKNNILIVLAWNFYEDIKKNNSDLSNNFINIKELETNS